MIINISLSAFLTFKLKAGILGIATALTISSILHFIALLYALHKQVGGFNLNNLLKPMFRMFLATIFTGIFLWVPMRFLDQFVFDTTRTIPLILLTLSATIIGFLVYIALSKLFKIQELQEFMKLFQKIGNWQKTLKDSDEVIEPSSPSQEIKPL
jgi:peptidoglycan biosynthesis protein MviN/MurJ (putative lipid II flippase)